MDWSTTPDQFDWTTAHNKSRIKESPKKEINQLLAMTCSRDGKIMLSRPLEVIQLS